MGDNIHSELPEYAEQPAVMCSSFPPSGRVQEIGHSKLAGQNTPESSPLPTKKHGNFKPATLRVPVWTPEFLWDDFTDQFWNAAKQSQWEPSEYVRNAQLYLAGEALRSYRKVVDKYGDQALNDLDFLFDKMGPDMRDDPSVYKNKLKAFTADMSTDLNAMYKKMQVVADLAYPNARDGTKQDMLKDRFVAILPKKIRKQIQGECIRPTDVKSLASMAELVRHQTLEEEGSGTEDSGEESKTVQVSQVNVPTNNHNSVMQDNSRKPQKETRDCYWCGIKGHIESDCRGKKAGKPRTYNGPRGRGQGQGKSSQFGDAVKSLAETAKILRDGVLGIVGASVPPQGNEHQ